VRSRVDRWSFKARRSRSGALIRLNYRWRPDDRGSLWCFLWRDLTLVFLGNLSALSHATQQTVLLNFRATDDHFITLNQQAVGLQQVPGGLRVSTRFECTFDDALDARRYASLLDTLSSGVRWAWTAFVFVFLGHFTTCLLGRL
jgi:hypothetical protein